MPWLLIECVILVYNPFCISSMIHNHSYSSYYVQQMWVKKASAWFTGSRLWAVLFILHVLRVPWQELQRSIPILTGLHEDVSIREPSADLSNKYAIYRLLRQGESLRKVCKGNHWELPSTLHPYYNVSAKPAQLFMQNPYCSTGLKATLSRNDRPPTITRKQGRG